MKLNLGCGSKPLAGYINIDIVPAPGVDLVADVRKLSFDDNTVDAIYACHILEHFSHKETKPIIREWNRVLVPGGQINISVPDFDSIVLVYQQTHNLSLINGLLNGGQKIPGDAHINTFNFPKLQDILLANGFISPRRYDWKNFLPEGFDDYSRAYIPHMNFETGTLMSLNVEANKCS